MGNRKSFFRSACLALVATLSGAFGPLGCGEEAGDAATPRPDGGWVAADSSADAPTTDVAQCVLKTCPQLGAVCGQAPDGCGGVLQCGSCPSGQHCGGGGPNKCGTNECVPKTCQQLGASCGLVGDGCESVLSCGECTYPDTCGGGGIPNQCGCAPWTCESAGAECGAVADGCGSSLDCGSCSGSQTCEGGKCIMVDPCVPDPCNGHGWCLGENDCYCDPGYAGATCSSCDGVWQEVAGSDPVACQPTTTTAGTTADETLDGTADADRIQGMDGNDTIRGLDGNDYLNGNAGADQVNGNGYRDEVHGGAGDDLVMGGAGGDLVVGGGGNDTVQGDLGDDRLIGGDGDDIVEGGEGGDYYVIDGLGNDTFNDSAGIDAARCIPGVKIVSDTMQGADRVLTLSTGGSVRIIGNTVESVLGCN